MRYLRSFFLAAALLTSALRPSVAHAQSDFERSEAQKRFDEGNKLYAAGRYDEARVKFVQAWAALKRPSVLFNLARAEQLAGRLAEAAREYRAYLRLTDPKIPERDRDEVRTRLAEVDAQLGRFVVSVPAGARVTIDGETIEDAALGDPVSVPPGLHEVRASSAGKTRSVDVLAVAGETKNVTLTFDELAPSAKSSAAAPAVHPGAAPSAASADLGAAPPAARERARSPWPVVGWSGVALGVVAASVGVGFAAASFSDADERDRLRSDPSSSQCPSPTLALCADLKDAAESRAANANRAYAFGAAGAVLGAAGAAILLLRVGTSDRTAARVLPVLSPTVAGISAGAAF